MQIFSQAKLYDFTVTHNIIYNYVYNHDVTYFIINGTIKINSTVNS